MKQYGDSSEDVGKKDLTFLEETEKALLWAAPVIALRMANMM
jgi:hypothetical protein